MDRSPPGSSVHEILQARILEQVAISSSRGSSQPKEQTHVSYVSCTGRQVLYLPSTTWKAHKCIRILCVSDYLIQFNHHVTPPPTRRIQTVSGSREPLHQVPGDHSLPSGCDRALTPQGPFVQCPSLRALSGFHSASSQHCSRGRDHQMHGGVINHGPCSQAYTLGGNFI